MGREKEDHSSLNGEGCNTLSPTAFTEDTALSIDMYQLTMAAAYLQAGQADKKAVFEMFVRKLPRNRSYLVAAGLEQAIHFLLNMKFNENHISYIKSLDVFKGINENFFEYLRKFKFSGTVWAIPEGTIIFPNEPIIRVEASIIESQIVETYLLSMINFQTLIATKASRIVNAAARGKKPIIEFGSRRAHGPEAAFLAARASFIGGCTGTSNVLAGLRFGIPVFGTMAHSFIMSFDREEDAFEQFLKTFPSNSFLLVDTYDTVTAIKKIIKNGLNATGIRLDSGDLYSLSIEARRLLDSAGYVNTKIMASGNLNEYVIQDLINKNAPIDFFGVGTELTTSADDPTMDGVYKLVALKIRSRLPSPSSSTKVKGYSRDRQEKILYRMKASPGRKTLPGPKQVYRFLDSSGQLKTDILALEDEYFENSIPLQKKVLDNGQLVHENILPSIREIQRYHSEQMSLLHSESKDLDFIPQKFPVILSDRLQSLL
jgi:nicotinate phosphoribosyltransferase